jgi:hypothetical protein
VSVLTAMSDLVWEWKLVTWPTMLGLLAVLWISRRDTVPFIAAVAPYLRYCLILIALGSLAIFLVSFFATGKGQDRLAHIPIGLSLIPLWIVGAVAAFLVPRAT